MLQISIPKDQNKIQMQIQALKWQLERDTRVEDRIIHQQAIEKLQQALRQQ